MKLLKIVAGIICVLIGGLWTLQGLNIVGGSFMTGQTQWLVIGLIVALVGVALLAASLGRRR